MIQYGIAAILLLLLVIGAGLTQSGSWVAASPEEDEGYVEIVSVFPPPKAPVTIDILAQSSVVEPTATCDANVRDLLLGRVPLAPGRKL